MFNDFVHALRLLRRRPGSTLTAVVTLAVGIGATTGVYSIYSAVLLKPLPFDHPERVVAIWVRQATGGLYGISGGTLAAVRSLPAVDRAAVTVGTDQVLLGGGEPEVLRGALVTGEFFAVFGVRATVGRVLDVAGTGGGTSPVVLSYRLWQRRFGGDPGVVGRTLRLGDSVHTVIGVMPESFRYPQGADYWAPYRVAASELARFGPGPFTGIARLESAEISAASAQAAVLGASAPGGSEDAPKVILVPLVESMAGLYRSNLTLLLGAVVMVLLISCFNVANLLLAHAAAREHELAIRAAIGATRLRLLRQLAAESIILAVAAAVAGLSVAQFIIMSLPLLGALDIPRIDEVGIDWRVLVFAIAAAGASVCIFGIGPSWIGIRRVAPVPGAGRSVAGPQSRTMSHVLIALQIAATLTLLIGSALALTSLYRLHTLDLGFDTRHLTVTTIRPAPGMLKQRGVAGFYERLLDRLREQPEFEAVAAMSHVPLEPVLAGAASVTTDDGVVASEGRNGPRMRVMSPAAFEVLGVPIVNGRDFLRADRDGAPLVTIVNETLARRLWGTRDPTGASLSIDSRGTRRSFRVVGVVRDFRPYIRRVPQPEVYVASTQEQTRLKLVVKSTLPPDAVAARVREVILSENPEVPITGVSTVSGLVWEETAYTRFHAALLTAFGVSAALLASTGILAVVMYMVARRTREIGIRIAIGAAPRQVVRLLVAEMTRPLVAGLAAGLVGVYNLASLLQRQGVLFEVNRFDPAVYAALTAALSGLAIFAAWLPARRAARIEPLVSLRSE